MLTVHVKTGTSMFNDSTNEIIADTVPVVLEHSLLTLSEWEAKYKKPFLSDLPEHKKSEEETIDYIRMMVLDQTLPVTIFNTLIQIRYKIVLKIFIFSIYIIKSALLIQCALFSICI